MEKSTPFYYFLSFLLNFIATSFVFHSELLDSNKEDKQSMFKNGEKRGYIAYFLIHNFILFLLLTTVLVDNKKKMVYNMAIGLVITHLVYLIVKRPYESGFNNFSIIFNQFAILFSFFWIFSKGTALDTY